MEATTNEPICGINLKYGEVLTWCQVNIKNLSFPFEDQNCVGLLTAFDFEKILLHKSKFVQTDVLLKPFFCWTRC